MDGRQPNRSGVYIKILHISLLKIIGGKGGKGNGGNGGSWTLVDIAIDIVRSIRLS